LKTKNFSPYADKFSILDRFYHADSNLNFDSTSLNVSCIIWTVCFVDNIWSRHENGRHLNVGRSKLLVTKCILHGGVWR